MRNAKAETYQLQQVYECKQIAHELRMGNSALWSDSVRELDIEERRRHATSGLTLGCRGGINNLSVIRTRKIVPGCVFAFYSARGEVGLNFGAVAYTFEASESSRPEGLKCSRPAVCRLPRHRTPYQRGLWLKQTAATHSQLRASPFRSCSFLSQRR
eukprot:6177256-Pleurochrysis_carterae.AAC.1